MVIGSEVLIVGLSGLVELYISVSLSKAHGKVTDPFQNALNHTTVPCISSRSSFPSNQSHLSPYHSDKCFPSIYLNHRLLDYHLLEGVDGGI
jgi:hypothetical protein